MIGWKSKLASRKLWAAVAGFITGIVVLFGGNGDVAGGAVVSLGSIVAYIIGEAWVDAACREGGCIGSHGRGRWRWLKPGKG